ncbi:Acetoin utilization deacetylase AcuC [Allopseudospirillum japonicum]|uniref:Acetoin utilization deacetylase AcuC n=1 Tax=Allopseudospirillum japonicum TaxID=64971 RepID=A0A1H6SC32_9GAMM|nr:histone deacetylase family protein [Allopseudospirillum japonicum]SEI60962.1 Acetoin utilization deacetylase AcuC [Allopseudospirillum japonicum]
MITSFISHQDCTLHNMGPWHPESPHRLTAIDERLRRSGLMQELLQYKARPVTPEQLFRVHPKAHVRSLELSVPEDGVVAIEDETLLCPHSLEAATMAAGAVIRGTEQVLKNQADNVFCAVRPPGHHAERVESMGFCFYNNVAVGVEHAIQNFGVQRVAVLDFDVHHANGTVDIFKGREDVLVCSSFQHPFYPWRYADSEWDNILNTPLDAGAGGLDFRRAIEAQWLPALQMHRPDIIFISAGFDAHQEDPMGELNLLEDDYYWITQLICDVAKTYSQGRVVSVLEGGYELDALARSVEKHVQALAGL